MKKSVVLFIGIFASMALATGEIQMPQPAQKTQYKELFKEYLSKDDDSFNKYEFEQDVKLHEKYCNLGVTDACDTLGNSYVFGFGVKQDIKKGIQYIKHAVKNASDDIFKTQYIYSLELAKDIEDKKEDMAIRQTIKTFSQKSSECQNRDGDKDACFKAVVITGLLPHSMLGIGDYAGFFEMLYDNDIAINGVDNSKIAKMLKAYEEILK